MSSLVRREGAVKISYDETDMADTSILIVGGGVGAGVGRGHYKSSIGVHISYESHLLS